MLHGLLTQSGVVTHDDEEGQEGGDHEEGLLQHEKRREGVRGCEVLDVVGCET